MAKLKFSKGPWIFEPHGGFGGENPDGTDCPLGFISFQWGAPFITLHRSLVDQPRNKMLANGSLIAAAPDMYAALEAILAKVDADDAAMVSFGLSTAAPHSVAALARAALAKAVTP